MMEKVLLNDTTWTRGAVALPLPLSTRRHMVKRRWRSTEPDLLTMMSW